jgi:hypothetical protein
MIHAIILTVPRKAAVRPAAAPAIIKQIFNKHGVRSKCLDINLDYFTRFQQQCDPILWNEIDEYLFIKNKQLSASAQIEFDQLIQHWIDLISTYQPKQLLISVFSWQAQRFTEKFLEKFRSQYTCEVIIGGQGLIREENGSFADRPTFAHYLKQLGLIDHWIRGEAETTIPAIIQGNYNAAGIDTDFFAERSNIADQPVMDFGDFDIKSYKNGSKHGVLPIESSRGCIRKCVFCDIPTIHGGFRVKSGSQLANEMIHYYEQYGVRDFFFHDALCNGSMKDFRQFNRTLIDYYESHNLPDRHFAYSSHAIVRRPGAMRPIDFEHMARAGAETMVLGIESGSDRVLADMRKDFTIADLDYNMAQYSKNKMQVYFLMITGFPTETELDHQASLDLLTKYQRFVADGTIIGVNLGTTLTIEQGTPMFDQPNTLNIIGINNQRPQGADWMCKDNPELTYKKRIMRRIQIQEHCEQLGYTFWKGDDQLKTLMDKYQERLARIQELVH